jgi:hypothetical protein
MFYRMKISFQEVKKSGEIGKSRENAVVGVDVDNEEIINLVHLT